MRDPAAPSDDNGPANPHAPNTHAANQHAVNIPGLLRDIAIAYEKGNLGRTAQLLRHGEAMAAGLPYWPYYRGLLAFEVKLRDAGLAQCDAARRACPADAFSELAPQLNTLESALKSMPDPTPSPAPAYLLIKTWGYGFWSDIGHFVSALLLAELTGRIPVIHWGAGCRYTDAPDSDAFSTFFAPVNDWGLVDMRPLGPDYYPEKWRGADLCADRFEQWFGLGGRRSGLYLLNRPEQVIVSDFYTQIFELTPWLARDHWLHGCNAHEVFARLYRKYFKLRSDIQADIDAFAARYIKGRPTLGVHVRNAEKASESARFQDDSDQITVQVEQYMQQDETLRLFLLTDSAQAVETYRARYGDRVFFTDSARAEGDVGVHVAGEGSRHQLGVEVITDTYLAAACDAFIGLGTSNLPCMVSVLKDWPAGAIHLIGDNRLLQENTLLHDW
ncbi:MAG: hypothetical protein ACJAU6_001975 [Alphaproteobacteria bacterium]|jgi:hypothetical protein